MKAFVLTKMITTTNLSVLKASVVAFKLCKQRTVSYEEATLSSVNKFTFQKIGDKTIRNQTFHNSEYYKGASGLAAVCRVTMCTVYVDWENP